MSHDLILATHTLQNSYQIRFATLNDLEQILTIYNHEILTGTANWNDQAVALEQYQQRFKTCNSSNSQ